MTDDGAKMDVEQLVAEHHGAVYGYAFRLTGSVPDAEDLTQQVFLAAQQRFDQLRKPECARSWLFVILRNAFVKGRQRPQAASATTVGLNLDSLPAEADDEEPMDRERLQDAIAELPAEFRMVLLMFYFEECSYREIAEGLEMPIGTVMSRLARAKQQLRARLVPQGSVQPQPSATG